MRVQITFDDNNYITKIVSDTEGNYDLPDDFNLEIASAYHLVDGEIILDEDKAAFILEEDEKRMESQNLYIQLKQSDEDLLEFIEELFTFKNPLTFISDMIALMKNYATLVATRQSIRERIRELQK